MMKRLNKALALALSASMVLGSATVPTMAATSNPDISEREVEHKTLAKDMAAQGMVLLENQGGLPISASTGTKVALYGIGVYNTVKGGTGSGAVNQRDNVTVEQGFTNAGYEIVNEDFLDAVRTNTKEIDYTTVEGGTDMIDAAAEETDTAIYVISRNSGEGADRTATKGDYFLSDAEEADIALLSQKFDNTIIVLNVGGIIDTAFYQEIEGLDGMLLMSQAGMTGGDAVVEVLNGTVTPSGKLTDTWPTSFDANPSSAGFGKNDGNSTHEYYTDDIYVGYRYYDTFGLDVNYPFGYGLSYTTFDIQTDSVTADMDTVTVKATVTNTGSVSGKEVVEVYFSAPDGEIDKPYQELAGYAKTDELAPGEKQTLTITYETNTMSSYDMDKAAYIMEDGDYVIRVGNSSRNTHVAAKLNLASDLLTEQYSNLMTQDEEMETLDPSDATPITYTGEAEEIAAAAVISLDATGYEPTTVIKENEDVNVYVSDTTETQFLFADNEDGASATITRTETASTYKPEYTVSYDEHVVKYDGDYSDYTLMDVYNGTISIEEYVSSLSLYEMANLVNGSSASATVKGVAGSSWSGLADTEKIAGVNLSDGPAGLRITQSYIDYVQATDTYVEGNEYFYATTSWGGTRYTKVDADSQETYDAALAKYGTLWISTGSTMYQYATAWPIGTLLAQTWDKDLIYEFGKSVGEEMVEFGIGCWLAPGMNIHRNALCGRNFEYYSEDPLVVGVTGTATVLGVQSNPGVGVSIKHYAVNSQETSRTSENNTISERALREIYLKGFEMVVKQAQPYTIMSSYNLNNGRPAADDYDLCTEFAKNEWGFQGMIMTDWGGGQSTPMYSMHAGNDLICPGKGYASIIKAFYSDPEFGTDGYFKTTVVEKQVVTDEGTYNEEETVPVTGDYTLDAAGTYTFSTTVAKGVELNAKIAELVEQGIATTSTNSRTGITTVTYKATLNSTSTGQVLSLGDVQKSTINVLKFVMKSLEFAKLNGIEAAAMDDTNADILQTLTTSSKGQKTESVEYKTITEGYDWGPAVSKLVISAGKEMDASTVVDPANFTVNVTRKALSGWLLGPSQGTLGVTAAYVSDADGNKAESGAYITLELEVGPTISIGSPFNYNFFGSTHNEYVDMKFVVTMNENMKAADGSEVALIANKDGGNSTLICDDFDLTGEFSYADPVYGDIDLHYASYAPESAKNDGHQNALIIWLHGAGEGGDDPRVALIGNKVVNLATDTVQQYFDDGAYILAPQCETMWMDDGTGEYTSDGTSMYTKSLMALIEDFVEKHPDVDTDRIILGGCSNGGYMTMNMLIHYPDYFAAAYPTCEALANSTITDKEIESIKDIPIWFTAAKTDTTVPICTKNEAGEYEFNGNYSPKAYERLVAAGAKDVHFTLWDNVLDTTGLYTKADGSTYEYNGHWSWLYVLNNQCTDTIDGQETTIWQWLSTKVKVDETAEMKEELAEAEETIADLKEQVAEAKAEAQAAQKTADEAQAAAEAAQKAADEKSAEAAAKAEAAQKAADEAQAAAEAAQKTADAATAKAEAAQAAAEAAQKTADEAKAAYEELKAESAAQKDEIAALKAAVAKLQFKTSKASVKSLKSKKHAITVTVKAVKKAAKYQIRYTQKKSFKGAKSVYTSKTVKTIKGLKSGKRCYVKVRAYAVIGGKIYKTNYSKVKSVKVK